MEIVGSSICRGTVWAWMLISYIGKRVILSMSAQRGDEVKREIGHNPLQQAQLAVSRCHDPTPWVVTSARLGHPNPNTKPSYNQCIIFIEISTDFPLFYGLTQTLHPEKPSIHNIYIYIYIYLRADKVTTAVKPPNIQNIRTKSYKLS